MNGGKISNARKGEIQVKERTSRHRQHNFYHIYFLFPYYSLVVLIAGVRKGRSETENSEFTVAA